MTCARIFSTLGCPELNVPQALALAERAGLDGIELRAAGGTLDLPDHLARHYGTPEAAAHTLGNAARRIFAFGTSLRLTGAVAAAREQFLQFVPWAEALGVRWLRAFDGEGAAEPAGEKEAAETIRWWRDLRRERGWGVDCIVETHDSLLDSARIARFVTASPGTKILWDAHHTWKRHGEDPCATWRAIGPHVAHIHVKDSVSRPGARLSYTYVPPGHGEFPMAPLAGLLREEFHGAVCLEWERLWHPDLPPLEVAIAAAAATHWW